MIMMKTVGVVMVLLLLATSTTTAHDPPSTVDIRPRAMTSSAPPPVSNNNIRYQVAPPPPRIIRPAGDPFQELRVAGVTWNQENNNADDAKFNEDMREVLLSPDITASQPQVIFFCEQESKANTGKLAQMPWSDKVPPAAQRALSVAGALKVASKLHEKYMYLDEFKYKMPGFTGGQRNYIRSSFLIDSSIKDRIKVTGRDQVRTSGKEGKGVVIQAVEYQMGGGDVLKVAFMCAHLDSKQEGERATALQGVQSNRLVKDADVSFLTGDLNFRVHWDLKKRTIDDILDVITNDDKMLDIARNQDPTHASLAAIGFRCNRFDQAKARPQTSPDTIPTVQTALKHPASVQQLVQTRPPPPSNPAHKPTAMAIRSNGNNRKPVHVPASRPPPSPAALAQQSSPSLQRAATTPHLMAAVFGTEPISGPTYKRVIGERSCIDYAKDHKNREAARKCYKWGTTDPTNKAGHVPAKDKKGGQELNSIGWLDHWCWGYNQKVKYGFKLLGARSIEKAIMSDHVPQTYSGVIRAGMKVQPPVRLKPHDKTMSANEAVRRILDQGASRPALPPRPNKPPMLRPKTAPPTVRRSSPQQTRIVRGRQQSVDKKL